MSAPKTTYIVPGLLKATADELKRTRMPLEMSNANSQVKQLIDTLDNPEDIRAFKQVHMTTQLQRLCVLNNLNNFKSVDEEKGEETLTMAKEDSGLMPIASILNKANGQGTPAGPSNQPLLLGPSPSSKRSRDEDDDNPRAAIVHKKSSSMTLIQMVDVLKGELGIDGTPKAVVTDAANQLEVPTDDKSLVKIAADCLSELGYDV